MRAISRSAGIALWLLAAGCRTSPATQLVVVIDTDIHASVMDGFATRVIDQDDRERAYRRFTLGDDVRLPADYAIGPRGGDARRRVRVEVEALAGDEVLFATHAVTSFRAGRSLRLDLFLAGRCLEEANACGPDERCTQDGCVPEELDPDDLLPFVAPGPVADAGASDGGTPALLGEGDLVHSGSFHLPDGIFVGDANLGFEYGGRALAFNPANGSLFMVGHPWDQLSAEVTIPAVGGTATVLQALTDPVEGRLGLIGPDDKYIGGQLVWGGSLYVSAYLFDDGVAEWQELSHFVRPLDLSTRGEVEGPFQIGERRAAFYAGYLGVVPEAWRGRLGGPALTGHCCYAIQSASSYGPAVFALDPSDIGVAQSAAPLLYYPEGHETLGTGTEPGVNPLFNATTRVTGVVMPQGSSSVLFFGWHGIGPYCYGKPTDDPALDRQPDPDNPGRIYCFDPSSSSPYHGPHAFPYRTYVWAYEAEDLAEVHRGSLEPWEPLPYAVWELELPAVTDDDRYEVGGAAYDPSTGRIFVSQVNGDGTLPLVHVFAVSIP